MVKEAVYVWEGRPYKDSVHFQVFCELKTVLKLKLIIKNKIEPLEMKISISEVKILWTGLKEDYMT